MSSWSNFKTNNNLIVVQSEIPYISEVDGTAIIGTTSQIIINGFNFNPASEVICSAGIISNIQKSPEQIIFDCLASSPGSFLVEVRNGILSSLDWNSNYQPLLIARNSLSLTNGWLNFRSINPSLLGNVTSHINASLLTKTFSNSGFQLDSTRGLCFTNSTATANTTSNYIQLDSYLFELTNASIEIIANLGSTISNNLNIDRLRIGVGLLSTNNSAANQFELTNNNQYSYICRVNSYTTLPNLLINPNSQLVVGGNYFVKIIFDFPSNKVKIHKLTNALDLNATNLIDEIPINYLGRQISTEGVPLFNFYNSGSLSSVIAMKID